jgi:G2/mitotic-specific cyclin 1/2
MPHLNLDGDDLDDPLMAAEYVVEIFEYMKELEVYLKTYLDPHTAESA